jgi:hypothetical protein
MILFESSTGDSVIIQIRLINRNKIGVLRSTDGLPTCPCQFTRCACFSFYISDVVSDVVNSLET